jgi:predicted permease
MIRSLIARGRSLWRGVRRHAALDAEMAEEFGLHVELRAADLVRAGLAPAEAARRARLEFGSVERYKHEGRRSRGLRPFDRLNVSWLDFKLGFRMLVKYPGLTIVGGLAMAFAIWVGAGTFEFVTQVLHPTLPLPQGDRIVALRNWDLARSRVEPHALHDLATWRDELRSVRELGAFMGTRRNLITGDGRGEPIGVVEISASAFRVTRVPPLLGRSLVAADEQPGAPAVVVLGYDAWQRRFAGDSAVVGRNVRLGTTVHTVVGVMPDGYGFPASQGVLWTPLRLDAAAYGPGQGPAIQLFGRLAPGIPMDEAQAELAALGRRAATDSPRTHERLRPEVRPYLHSILDVPLSLSLAIGSSNVALLLLLVLISGNVALLMFARAATREAELVVRTALGASRGRIVMQLFAEALVLGVVAMVLGLAGVSYGLRWGLSVVQNEFLNGAPIPFWFHASLSPSTVVYAGLLTLLGAVIAGVLPALKVTRGLGGRLKAGTAGGGGLRFGGIWTAVIVSQVAVTVAFPVVAFFVRRDAVQIQSIRADFPAAEYLSVQLQMDRDPRGVAGDTSQAAFRARFRATSEELERRLATDPDVVGVTFADRLPRMYHPHRLIEVDDGGAAPLRPEWPAGYRVSDASVALDYFDVLETPILAGRGFHSGDLAPDAHSVIVNQSFVHRVLGGRNPIGRRIRYVYAEGDEAPKAPEERGPWYEIVGVVPDLGMAPDGFDPKVAGLYHARAPGDLYPVEMAVHVRGDRAALEPRLRTLAAAVDPTLRLDQLVPMDELSQSELQFLDFWFRLTVLVSAVAVLLSLAGIYSVMSFTVARRTREIGIRVALGAHPRRVVLEILRRPLVQVALGVVAGAGLMAALSLGPIGAMSFRTVGLFVAYALFMLGVCLLACIVPTRRALQVEPTEALREDG